MLDALADEAGEADAELIQACLAWEPTIDVDALATAAALTPTRVKRALTRLGTAGQVGYDVTEAAYFHRILPYHPATTGRMNPRLSDARRLVDDGAVVIDGAQAWVTSGADRYQLSIVDERAASCTCAWWARHRGGRGPCKHVLAVDLVHGPNRTTA